MLLRLEKKEDSPLLLKNNKGNSNLHTKVYKDKDDQTMIELSVGNSRGNQKYQLPADSLIYWYPLYFYYDWNYSKEQQGMVLELAEDAPEATRVWFSKYEEVTLEELLGDEGLEAPYQFVNQDKNQIAQDNFALMLQFAELGLVTPVNLRPFTIEDCDQNASILKVISQDIHNKLVARYKKDSKSDTPVVGIRFVNEDQGLDDRDFLDTIIYQYATDYELQLLIQIGCAYNLNGIMRKIAKIEEGK